MSAHTLQWLAQTQLGDAWKGTAVIAQCEASKTTTYQIQKYGNTFIAVVMVKSQADDIGTTNFRVSLDDFANEVIARDACTQDWKSGKRK